MNKKPFSFAIIGCGLTGTSLLYQLVTRIKQCLKKEKQLLRPLKIIVFDKNDNPGPGLPYNSEIILPCHLTNMQAVDMSIVSGCPDDLTNWMSARQNDLKLQYPELGEWISEADKDDLVKAHPPRMIIGLYLSDRFNEAAQIAAELGISLQVYNKSEVTDIQIRGRELVITALNLETGEIIHCPTDKALLATGHWFNTIRKPGYFSSPWPAQILLKKIPENEAVAIIGTSLSAIDTVLTLFSEGNFIEGSNGSLQFQPSANSRTVTMFSRNGLLPKIRGCQGAYKNKFFTMAGLQALMAIKKDGLTLADIFNLLNRELTIAYGKTLPWDEIRYPQKDHIVILKEEIKQAGEGDNPGGDILWQTILFQSLSVIQTAYINLKPDQKQQFESKFHSIFMAHAAPITRVIARKILALLESGYLKIHRLSEPFELNKPLRQSGFEFTYLDFYGKNRSEVFKYVVDARGQSRSYHTNPSTLAKNILSSGLVQIEEQPLGNNKSPAGFSGKPKKLSRGRGVWVDPKSFRVIAGSHKEGMDVSSKLFAVGAMIQGQIVNASMARESVTSTYRIAGQIIDEYLSSKL